ncbi:FAD-dependent oxidoreductase [Candidatus Mycoplasma pogonae]
MKIISIGANHAGTSFLRTIKQLAPDYEVVAYDRNTDISFLGCGIALWVGGEFEDPDGLFYSSAKQLTQMGVKVKLAHEVVAIDRHKKTVTVKNLETGEEFQDNYDKLVFAGGTWPIVPPFPGVNLKNILISKIFMHAKEIKAKAEDQNVKNVVVIGAGYIGVEIVEAFHKYGKKVTLIDLQSGVFPNYFDREFTSSLEETMAKEGVELHFGESVKEFKSKDGEHVSAVVTDKGEYPADLVIMSIGFKPNTELLPDVQKFANGAIMVDVHQATLTDKDIYAIGDSCSMINNVTHEYASIALATNAVKTGIVAAFNIAGKDLDFPGYQGTNAIHVFGHSLASTGFTQNAIAKTKLADVAAFEFVEDWDRNEFMREKYRVKFKITYDKTTKRLLGAQVGSVDVNHTEVIYAMSLAIQKQMTLPEISLMDFFFLPHFNKPFNFVIKATLKALGLEYSEEPETK